MELKRVLPFVYDDYSILLEDNISEEEIGRALKHFIQHVENEQSIDPTLLKFMAKWVRKIYETDNFNPWDAKKRGRPCSVYPNNYLFMLVWYRAYIDPNFCELPKNPGDNEGLYMTIARSLNKNDLQSLRAANLSNSVDDILLIDSESSVRRAIKQFQDYGFRMPGERFDDMHNDTQIEMFGRRVLCIDDDQDLYLLRKKILDMWLSIKT